ncbi:MAG: response regulator [Nitrospirales bacterium]|nr:response regulator [Nitrospirales bacterium]
MNKREIVHVECNSIYHKLFQRELSDTFGDAISYIGFSNHIEALDFLESNKAHLIISCINIQGQKASGLEFLRKCKTLWPDTPFLIHTALGYRDDFAHSGIAADAYVMKSSDPTELIHSIKRLLNNMPITSLEAATVRARGFSEESFFPKEGEIASLFDGSGDALYAPGFSDLYGTAQSISPLSGTQTFRLPCRETTATLTR